MSDRAAGLASVALVAALALAGVGATGSTASAQPTDAPESDTGREMEIRSVSVEATRQQLPQEYGVVTYAFVWTGFAVVDGASGSGDADASLPVGVILVLGVVAALAVWAAYRRRETDEAGATGEGGTPDGPGDDGVGTETAPDEASGAGGIAADDSGDGADEAAAPPWEDELLSNQEKVLALVEHEDGRMKQQAVAKTLGWTDAKTSQVVGKLRDADDLDAFRLGRENVLVLPGEEFGPGDPADYTDG